MNEEDDKQKKLNKIWSSTHKDYKSEKNGKKSVLVMRDGGTTLVPLEDLSDKEVEKLYQLKEDIFNVISAKDIKELHDNAWELKTEFADALDKFAKKAKEVSKTLVGLKDKVAGQRLEKDAYEARNVVLKNFFPSTLMKTEHKEESNQMNSSKEAVDEAYETDEDAKTELALYMDNEYSIYNQKKSIIANLMRKMKSGKYDPTLAPKLWAYWVESGAKAYAKEFATPGEWSKMFPKPLRDALAAELAKDEEEKIKNGEYGSDPSKL